MNHYYLSRVWNFFIRRDVASLLILAVIVLAALGSCFPQRPLEIESHPEQWAHWEESLHARYRGFTKLFLALRLFDIYHSPYLVTSIVLLVASTLVCTLNRWKGTWQRAFRRKVHCPDALFDVAEQKAELSLKPGVDLDILEKHLAARGMRVRLEVDGDRQHYRADRFRLSPLGTLVSHVGVILLLVGAVFSSAFSWREAVTFPPGENTPLPGSGWMILNEGFTIARYLDGSAADYAAQVRVTSPGGEIAHGVIRPNQPMSVSNHAIYLTGFTPTGEGVSLTLLLVRDPGQALVYTAGFLMLFGMTVSFNFPHCCIFARLEPDGTLRLAGRADRRAYHFPREFKTLIMELKGLLAKEQESDRIPC